MKILLFQSLPYLSSGGGLPKGTRAMLEGLAERGHSCQVVASASNPQDFETDEKFLAGLADRGIRVLPSPPGVAVFHLRGVEVHAVMDLSQLRAHGVRQIHEFEPTWTLVPEEPTYSLLKAALEASPSRVVYLAYSSALLGLGPMCFYPMPVKKELLRQAAGIIAVSNYLKGYIQRWAGLESVAVPSMITIPSLVYGPGPFPYFGCFDKGFVTMINPCAYKGIAIFLALAQAMPDVQFAAVPTWGTTKADRVALEQLPNIQLLGATADIDKIYAQTRVLLVPSLWDEALGVVATEAMLRGIPVLASNAGGLPEAKHGVDYVLPIRPVERYDGRLNDRMLPVSEVPEQEVGPWLEALQEVLSDRVCYERLSRASREASLAFVSKLGAFLYEDYLETLVPLSQSDRRGVSQIREQDTGTDTLNHSGLAGTLSPERRAFLALRLGKSRQG